MPHRVLFINRSFWPDTEATGQLLTDLCQDLSSRFDITVVAGLPNHLQPGAPQPIPGSDSLGAIQVRRVRHTKFSKHSFAGRIVNLVSFTFSAFISTLFLPRPDLIVTETDPFFLPLLGRWLKWRYRCQFVAYLQDVYPDVAVAVGKVREGTLTRILRSALVAAYRRADRVIVLSRCMARRCRTNGVPDRLIEILPNWVDTNSLQPNRERNTFRQEQLLKGRFTIMYSGNLGVGHLLQPVLEAAESLQNDPEILFLLIGEGAQKQAMQEWCQQRGLQNVRFLGYQPRETLGESLSAADVQIVSLRPEVSGCLMPSKLYGVLAAGVPVLAISPLDSELAEVVRQENIGAVCDASSATLTQDLIQAISSLRSNSRKTQEQGNRARQLAQRDYDRQVVTRRFGDLLEQILAESSSSTAKARS